MSPGSSALELQPRDIELFRELFESRIMALRHITVLHFGEHAEAARKRVQRLKAAGYLLRKQHIQTAPAYYLLTRRAYDVLREWGLLENYPQAGWPAFLKRSAVSPLTLAHEFEVMDVKTAFFHALQTSPLHLLDEFSTWPRLFQFDDTFHPVTRARVLVRPDGYIRIHLTEPGDGEWIHFLEVDRSTENLTTLVTKVQCYWDYYRRGGFARRCGQPREAYKRFPFRVLVTCKSAERRENLARRLLAIHPPIRAFVWLTTLAEVIDDPLGAIWLTPGDYLYAGSFSTDNQVKRRLLE